MRGKRTTILIALAATFATSAAVQTRGQDINTINRMVEKIFNLFTDIQKQKEEERKSVFESAKKLVRKAYSKNGNYIKNPLEDESETSPYKILKVTNGIASFDSFDIVEEIKRIQTMQNAVVSDKEQQKIYDILNRSEKEEKTKGSYLLCSTFKDDLHNKWAKKILLPCVYDNFFDLSKLYWRALICQTLRNMVLTSVENHKQYKKSLGNRKLSKSEIDRRANNIMKNITLITVKDILEEMEKKMYFSLQSQAYIFLDECIEQIEKIVNLNNRQYNDQLEIELYDISMVKSAHDIKKELIVDTIKKIQDLQYKDSIKKQLALDTLYNMLGTWYMLHKNSKRNIANQNLKGQNTKKRWNIYALQTNNSTIPATQLTKSQVEEEKREQEMYQLMLDLEKDKDASKKIYIIGSQSQLSRNSISDLDEVIVTADGLGEKHVKLLDKIINNLPEIPENYNNTTSKVYHFKNHLISNLAKKMGTLCIDKNIYVCNMNINALMKIDTKNSNLKVTEMYMIHPFSSDFSSISTVIDKKTKREFIITNPELDYMLRSSKEMESLIRSYPDSTFMKKLEDVKKNINDNIKLRNMEIVSNSLMAPSSSRSDNSKMSSKQLMAMKLKSMLLVEEHFKNVLNPLYYVENNNDDVDKFYELYRTGSSSLMIESILYLIKNTAIDSIKQNKKSIDDFLANLYKNTEKLQSIYKKRQQEIIDKISVDINIAQSIQGVEIDEEKKKELLNMFYKDLESIDSYKDMEKDTKDLLIEMKDVNNYEIYIFSKDKDVVNFNNIQYASNNRKAISMTYLHPLNGIIVGMSKQAADIMKNFLKEIKMNNSIVEYLE